MAWTDERLQERFDGIDRRFDGVDRRFDDVDRRFDRLENGLLEFRRELHAEIGDLRTTLNRIGGGIMVGLIGVIVSLLGVVAAVLLQGTWA